MKRLLLAIIAVFGIVIVPVAIGQTQTMPASSASRPASMPANGQPVYEGTIVDKDDKPLAGVTVRAFEAARDSYATKLTPLDKMTTGNDGKYVVRVKTTNPTAITVVVAEKDGYAVGCANFMTGNSFYYGNIRLGDPVTTSGTVVDEAGAPVANARVQMILYMRSEKNSPIMYSLPECEVASASTGADGRFEFKNTPAATDVAFIAVAPGKATICTGAIAINKTGKDDIKISLPAEATIVGVLKAKTGGTPIAGQTVEAMLKSANIFGVFQGVTDKDGKFQINALGEGEVFLRLASKPGQSNDWIIESDPVKVKAKQTVDIALDAVEGGIAEFVVRDATTKTPLSNALISVSPASGGGIDPSNVGVITDDKGMATMRLSTKKKRITVYYSGYESAAANTKIVTIADGKTETLEFNIVPQPVLKGIAKDENGNPIADAEVFTSSYRVVAAKTDKAGKFSFAVQSNMQNQTRAIPSIIIRQVAMGLIGTANFASYDSDVTITMKKGLTLNGLILDTRNAPIKGANVTVTFKDDSTYAIILSEQVTTNNKGEYSVPAVPEDKSVEISASAEGYGTGKTVEVTLYPKINTITADNIILADAKLAMTGRVETPDGKPIAGAKVMLSGQPSPVNSMVTTGADGKFVFKGLVEGAVSIIVKKDRSFWKGIAQAGDTDVVITLKVPDQTTDEDATTTKPATAPATKSATEPASKPVTLPGQKNR